MPLQKSIHSVALSSSLSVLRPLIGRKKKKNFSQSTKVTMVRNRLHQRKKRLSADDKKISSLSFYDRSWGNESWRINHLTPMSFNPLINSSCSQRKALSEIITENCKTNKLLFFFQHSVRWHCWIHGHFVQIERPRPGKNTQRTIRPFRSIGRGEFSIKISFFTKGKWGFTEGIGG